jgi:hypothetical protein
MFISFVFIAKKKSKMATPTPADTDMNDNEQPQEETPPPDIIPCYKYDPNEVIDPKVKRAWPPVVTFQVEKHDTKKWPMNTFTSSTVICNFNCITKDGTRVIVCKEENCKASNFGTKFTRTLSSCDKHIGAHHPPIKLKIKQTSVLTLWGKQKASNSAQSSSRSLKNSSSSSMDHSSSSSIQNSQPAQNQR